MIVKVTGKRYVNGVNENTGKYRNGVVIHTTYEDGNIEGIGVMSFWINHNQIPKEGIIIGNHYRIEMYRNYVVLCEHIDD